MTADISMRLQNIPNPADEARKSARYRV